MKLIKRICIWTAVILISVLSINLVFEDFGIWDALLDKRMTFNCYSVINGTEQGEVYQITAKGRFKRKADGYDLKLIFPDAFPFQWTNADDTVGILHPKDQHYPYMMLAFQVARKSTLGDPNVDVDIPIVHCAFDPNEGYFYMLVSPSVYTTDYFELYGSVEENVPMETIAEHFTKGLEFFNLFKD